MIRSMGKGFSVKPGTLRTATCQGHHAKGFHQIAARAAKNIKIARMRIPAERLLHLQCQFIHAAPHRTGGRTPRLPGY
jgi:hypothetical protein